MTTPIDMDELHQKTGGRAYPHSTDKSTVWGMTIRDVFIGHAMASNVCDYWEKGDLDKKVTAKRLADYADAAMMARELL